VLNWCWCVAGSGVGGGHVKEGTRMVKYTGSRFRQASRVRHSLCVSFRSTLSAWMASLTRQSDSTMREALSSVSAIAFSVRVWMPIRRSLINDFAYSSPSNPKQARCLYVLGCLRPATVSKHSIRVVNRCKVSQHRTIVPECLRNAAWRVVSWLFVLSVAY